MLLSEHMQAAKGPREPAVLFREGFPAWVVDHLAWRESMELEVDEQGQPVALWDQQSGTAEVQQVQSSNRRRSHGNSPEGCAGPAAAARSVHAQPLQQEEAVRAQPLQEPVQPDGVGGTDVYAPSAANEAEACQCKCPRCRENRDFQEAESAALRALQHLTY